MAFTLKQAEDGTGVGEVCRKTVIGEATAYAWRKKYAGLMPSEDAAVAPVRGGERQAGAAGRWIRRWCRMSSRESSEA